MVCNRNIYTAWYYAVVDGLPCKAHLRPFRQEGLHFYMTGHKKKKEKKPAKKKKEEEENLYHIISNPVSSFYDRSIS